MQHNKPSYLEPLTLAVGGTFLAISLMADNCNGGLSTFCKIAALIEESTGASLHVMAGSAAFVTPGIYFFTKMYQIAQAENAEKQLANKRYYK